MNQRKDGVSDDLGFLAQQIEIKRVGVAALGDLLGSGLRDHAATRLCPGQRHLDLNVFADQFAIVENGAHLRRAECVAKQDGVENIGCHVCLPE